MDNNYPLLDTDTDTSLAQPDLDQLRQDRLDRNRLFLQSVNAGVAAKVLPKQQVNLSTENIVEQSVICIQKHWRGRQGRKLYVSKLYDKFMKDEETQKEHVRQQMEEGELLVENHQLEVLLDDNRTTRRNAERRYITKVVTIQRALRAYLQRKYSSKHLEASTDNSGNQGNGNCNHSNSNQVSKDPINRSVTCDQSKNKLDECLSEIGEREFHSDDESQNAFVNPLVEITKSESDLEKLENLKENKSNSSSPPVFHDTKNVISKRPDESEEDYFRRHRKQSLLSQAHEFAELKKANAHVLPFNLHIRAAADTSLEHPTNLQGSKMADTVIQSTEHFSSERTTSACHCDENSNDKVSKSFQSKESVRLKTNTEVLSTEKTTHSMDKNAETKGGNSKLSIEEELSAFDVYNIETAMPNMDWKSLEEKLKAASEEAKQIQKARRNDREEIRKKLAMGVDDEDGYDDNDDEDIGCKKPNLQSRLHSGLQAFWLARKYDNVVPGQHRQGHYSSNAAPLAGTNDYVICFMNESPGDTDSEGRSPRQHEIHDNVKLMSKVDDLVDSDNNLRTVADLNKTLASSETARSSSPPRLKSAKPDSEPVAGDFHSRQEQLQNEAKMALAQAGSMAHMQLEIEKQLQKKSPMAEMVGIPGLGERRRKKLGVRKLQEMNLAQIQVLYNDLHTQIENLNEELVHLLMERDELHMEQDSMLVDIEDLTRRAEEIAEKTKGGKLKDSKNSVKGKLPSR